MQFVLIISHSILNELKFLRKYFSTNGYPIFLFDRYVKEFLPKLYTSEQETECSNNFLYIKFSYFGPQSEKLKFELSSLFNKYLSGVTPRIILNNSFTLSSLFQHKDKLPTALRCYVLYKISCMQCMSVYIGSKCRRLHTRVPEHAGVRVWTHRERQGERQATKLSLVVSRQTFLSQN